MKARPKDREYKVTVDFVVRAGTAREATAIIRERALQATQPFRVSLRRMKTTINREGGGR